MHVTVCIEGINLERLLREAAQQGLLIRSVKRTGTRTMCLRVRADQVKQLTVLCEKSGWTCEVVRAGILMRLSRMLRARPALVPALTLCVLLVYISSQMILLVRVDGSKENTAEVHRVLAEQDIRPGRMKSRVSLDTLRAVLMHRLPGLAYAGAYFAGSTLVIDCHPANEGESLRVAGSSLDIVATQSGVVSRIWASSGTPMVETGQAVHKGQVLIAGAERGEKGTQIPVQAQGFVSARVYVGGEARVSLFETHSVETGQTRTRVTLRTPWTAHVVRDAEPFESQETDRQRQGVVGLYLPLWREIETYVQTEVFRQQRNSADAASMAQGAAEKIAREQCPSGALILDKIVNYSMIDNEFVYASVVLELEMPIAVRLR